MDSNKMLLEQNYIECFCSFPNRLNVRVKNPLIEEISVAPLLTSLRIALSIILQK